MCHLMKDAIRSYKADYIDGAKRAEAFGNHLLYQMCEEYPGHVVSKNDYASEETVAGKMWLIGRAYAASPQRRQMTGILNGIKCQQIMSSIQKDMNDGYQYFFDDLAEILAKDLKDLDESINKLREKSYAFTDAEKDGSILRDSVELLESFSKMIIKGYAKLDNEYIAAAARKTNRLTGKNGFSREQKEAFIRDFAALPTEDRQYSVPVSFCSKYLHFHLPNIVFIKDTYSTANASKAVGRMQRRSKNEKKFSSENINDYYMHARKCYYIAERLYDGCDDEQKDRLTQSEGSITRHVDTLLLKCI